MPNWCSNTLTVTGPTEELDRFLKPVIDGTDNFFNYHLPMPEALEGTVSPTPESPEPHPNWAELLANGEITQEWYDDLVARRAADYEAGRKALAETGYQNWHDWQARNWGVKWGASHTRITETGAIRFDTPWAPPTRGVEKISMLFPELTFVLVYDEDGMEFAGARRIQNGLIWTEIEIGQDDYPKLEFDEDGGWSGESYDAFLEAKAALLDRLFTAVA